MKIFMARLECESNSFCDYKADVSDFDFLEGEAIIERFAASKVFSTANAEIIPSIYAHCIPCVVKESTYLYFEKKIIDVLKNHKDVDGIYLYLHGCMHVENIGSGDYQLVKAIRTVVGYNVPVSLALDFHASIPDGLLEEVNAVAGYRTAPHVDNDVTEVRAAKALLRCIKDKILPHPAIVRVPIIASDEFVTTREPLLSFMQNLYMLDYDDDVVSAAMFNSHPWLDAEYATPCIVICRESGRDAAMKNAGQLARKLWDDRHAIIRIDTYPVDEAVRIAVKNDDELMFVLDCGDNPFAGARGDGTVMLDKFLQTGAKDVLIAGIFNKEVAERLLLKNTGDDFEEILGKDATESHIICTKISGVIKAKGRTLGQTGKKLGNAVLLDCGGVDVILSDSRAGFTSRAHMEELGINPNTYKVIVVKLGFLWGQLQMISPKHITASTPGQSTNNYRLLPFKRRDINVYPLVKDMQVSFNI